MMRGGFGLTKQEFDKLVGKSRAQVVDKLFDNSAKSVDLKFNCTLLPHDKKSLSKTQKQALNKRLRQDSRKINNQWLREMSMRKGMLREKLTIFWHGHFACQTDRGDYDLQLNNLLRTNALGDYRALVKAVAHNPGMIEYLDNARNRKGHPNENFAREVMELFTIGRDKYTETDIQEAARSFTGWKHDHKGTFVFNEKQHDYGSKTFMGQTGNFDGDEVIDIILQNKLTAQHIAKKLYLFFVSDVAHQERIEEIADVFFNSDYDIEKAVRHIFMADWFYSDDVIGTKIKSPMELIIGVHKQFQIEYGKAKSLWYLQYAMGQVMFYPPNVAGWPGGQRWINTTTMAYRMLIPALITNDGLIEWDDLDYPDSAEISAQLNRVKRDVHKYLEPTADWTKFEAGWKDFKEEELVDFFLACEPSDTAKYMLGESRKDLRRMMLAIMSLPEYQLC